MSDETQKWVHAIGTAAALLKVAFTKDSDGPAGEAARSVIAALGEILPPAGHHFRVGLWLNDFVDEQSSPIDNVLEAIGYANALHQKTSLRRGFIVGLYKGNPDDLTEHVVYVKEMYYVGPPRPPRVPQAMPQPLLPRRGRGRPKKEKIALATAAEEDA